MGDMSLPTTYFYISDGKRLKLTSVWNYIIFYGNY